MYAIKLVKRHLFSRIGAMMNRFLMLYKRNTKLLIAKNKRVTNYHHTLIIKTKGLKDKID
jgi:hypothetical protein